MTAERVYTITRPTGYQVQVRAQSSEELWDGMAAHGWPGSVAYGDARMVWHCGSTTAAAQGVGQWTVRHG